MNISKSMLFSTCIILVIPLVALSTSNDLAQEIIGSIDNKLNQHKESNDQSRRSLHYPFHSHQPYGYGHFFLKKAANFEEILKPCNRMPVTGRGHDYANCVRQRMLLMGK